ncbi:hypothetical protein N7524_004448 [Penicillium chrysogenum]|nr:hypothetical protein N7524_004448 [Penicillium chrysogenum]
MASAYSTAQLSKYLEYITLPIQYAQCVHDPLSFPKTEEALTFLFRCQITAFPYDNLSVHYSATHIVDIHPESIYTKLMGSNDGIPSRRGGYCFECNILFYHVLRGLGFTAYMTGVRNRERIDGIPQGEFKGWTHLVNIVQLPSGKQYHVDAAFGGDGPTSPLQLTSGYTVKNLGTQEIRLVYGNMPKQSRPEQKLWIYQYRNGPEKEWNSFYCFSELEFFQDDFEVMNRFTSWEAFQKGNVWVVKFIRGGDTNGLPMKDGEFVNEIEDGVSIVGKIMFVNNVVKLNMGGKTRVIDSFQNEEDRLRGLKKWFSIVI